MNEKVSGGAECLSRLFYDEVVAGLLESLDANTERRTAIRCR